MLEVQRFGKCRKSDACLEVTEKVSIVRHFLSASELRRYGKPRFARPRTVALATTMCRNSDELAVGNSAKFSSGDEYCDADIDNIYKKTTKEEYWINPIVDGRLSCVRKLYITEKWNT